MQAIKDIKDIKGKRIMVRVDFNVPIDNGKVRDGFRIDQTLPSIEFLIKKGAKVILISHIGEGEKETLLPVYNFLKKKIKGIKFSAEIVGEKIEKTIEEMKNGEVILLENLRKNSGEVKNERSFAKELAKLGDVYVNDAFSASHREHSSIVGVPKFLDSYAGLLFEKEIKELSKVFTLDKHPFLFMLGGAKFGTKIPLLKKFLPKADRVFITGALANNFFMNMGFPIGKSLVDNEYKKEIAKIKSFKINIPEDVIAMKNGKSRECLPSMVREDESIVDIGERTIAEVKREIRNAKIILWNGPTGAYELGFTNGTTELLKEISKSNAVRIIGGGDTVALVNKLKLMDKVGFVSTGGGAMLDFLAKGTLPGIKALE